NKEMRWDDVYAYEAHDEESGISYCEKALQEVLNRCLPSDLKGLVSSMDDSRYRPHVMTILKEREDEIVKPLIQLLSDPELSIRNRVTLCLVELGHPQPLERLIETLNDSQHGIRSRGIEHLGKLGDPRAIGPLQKSLEKLTRYGSESDAINALF